MNASRCTSSREFDAYVEDLETRIMCALGVPGEILDCAGEPLYKDTLRNVCETPYLSTNNVQFPCPTDGSMVKLSDCWDCPRSQQCDIYATMLDEEF